MCDPHYRRGVALIFLFGLAVSTGGVIVRHVDQADGWQILFYRSLAAAVVLFLVAAYRRRGASLTRTRQTAGAASSTPSALGAGFPTYIQALTLTSVANVRRHLRHRPPLRPPRRTLRPA